MGCRIDVPFDRDINFHDDLEWVGKTSRQKLQTTIALHLYLQIQTSALASDVTADKTFPVSPTQAPYRKNDLFGL